MQQREGTQGLEKASQKGDVRTGSEGGARVPQCRQRGFTLWSWSSKSMMGGSGREVVWDKWSSNNANVC